jgi:hypothetical protein
MQVYCMSMTLTTAKIYQQTRLQERSKSEPVEALPRLRSVEAARFLEHQLFFWGGDARSPEGNLLVAAGFRGFHQADQPHAVRCYTVETAVARFTLHSTGACVQPLDGSPGIAYLRPSHRLYHWDGMALPLPCRSAAAAALTPLRANEFPPALAALLALAQDYETWVAPRLKPGARLVAWRRQKATASHGVRWLRPADSRRWLDACVEHWGRGPLLQPVL